MKGLITLASNIVGYVVILAIFVGIMATMAMFWFNFQTIPTEIPEKATTCDFAYMLSLWDKATVYPNVFNKTFLNTWYITSGGVGDETTSIQANNTANSIFENSSDYFLPKSDFFVHIADSEGKVYSLYVPPESKSVYKSCGEAYMSEKDLEKIKDTNLESVIVENGNIKTYKGDSKVPRNKIESICSLTTFMSDESDVEIGTVVVGVTTNLATKLRDGIYQVGVKNKSQEFYELGGYPEGCLVYGGTNEIKAKRSIFDFLGGVGGFIMKFTLIDNLGSWVGEKIPVLKTIWDWFKGKVEDAVEWIVTTEVHAECGFKWDWDNETRVLSVIPSNLWKSKIDWTKRSVTTCKLNTKIPERIVNESNLSEKLCRPREAHKHIFTIPGGLEKLDFFLRVGKVKDTWTEDKAVDFCIRRCKTSAPWYLAEYSCIAHCRGEGTSGIPEYRYARSQIYLFNNMPDDAIDIEYIYVKRNKLAEHGGVIEDVPRDEMVIISACDSWPTVSECGTSKQCHGPPCIDYGEGGKCESCFSEAEDSFCSPNYLENPPSVSEGLYSCQNVKSPLWPVIGEVSKCVPVILVNATFNGKEIGEREISIHHRENKVIDCSSHLNAEITWRINATGLCCANLTDAVDEDGTLVTAEDGTPIKECKEPTGFCPKMKLWSSINSSNAVVLDGERYIFEITQRVCRNDTPYNNADEAFIVANYTTENVSMEYVLRDSEVELTSLPLEEEPPLGEKSCEGISISKVTHEIKHDSIGDDEIDIYVSINNTGTGYCPVRAFVYNMDGDEKEHEPNTGYKTVNAEQTEIIKLTSDNDLEWGLSDVKDGYYVAIENDTGDELCRKGPISVGEENCEGISISKVTHEIKHDWIGDDEIDIYVSIKNTGTGYCPVRAFVYNIDGDEKEHEPNTGYKTVNAGQTEIIKLTSDNDLEWGLSDVKDGYYVAIENDTGDELCRKDPISVEEENCDDTSISDVTHEIVSNSIPLLPDNINIRVTIENKGTGYCPVRAFVYPKNSDDSIEDGPKYLLLPTYKTVNAGQTETIKLTSISSLWWVTSLNGNYTVKIKDKDKNILGGIWGPVSVP